MKKNGYVYTQITRNYSHVPTAFAICANSFAANSGVMITSIDIFSAELSKVLTKSSVYPYNMDREVSQSGCVGLSMSGTAQKTSQSASQC